MSGQKTFLFWFILIKAFHFNSLLTSKQAAMSEYNNYNNYNNYQGQGQGQYQGQYQGQNQYQNQYQGGESRGFDNFQEGGEDSERGFMSDAGNAVSGYFHKDETYVDSQGVQHNKMDKSHMVIGGLALGAAGAAAYTGYEKFSHREDGEGNVENKYEHGIVNPETGEKVPDEERSNWFKKEDGTWDKSHVALAGIGAVAAAALGKKVYDEFEEHEIPKEERRNEYNQQYDEAHGTNY